MSAIVPTVAAAAILIWLYAPRRFRQAPAQPRGFRNSVRGSTSPAFWFPHQTPKTRSTASTDPVHSRRNAGV